jgi:2-polyprenyl-6-methoxyphenol hydroxylase-like FAD-dependent oxidoreductase
MRYDLNAVLHESLVRCDIPVHHGKRLVRIDNIVRADGPLLVSFDDGTTAEADLVIGADGIHSRVRQAIAPDAKPTFAGINGIGGRTPLDRVRAYDAGPDEMTFVFGPRGFFGYSACGGDHAMWWTNLARSQPGTPSAEGASADLKKQLLDRFGRYSGPIATLIEHGEGIYAGDVFDLQTLPRWSQGRALLIGDAAHAVSPNSGQGASMALEDAMLLARLIGDGHSSASNIFETFEAARRERCEKIVAEGRRRSSGKMELPRLRSDLRNLAMSVGIRLFGAGASDWIYDHRIDWDIPASETPR